MYSTVNLLSLLLLNKITVFMTYSNLCLYEKEDGITFSHRSLIHASRPKPQRCILSKQAGTGQVGQPGLPCLCLLLSSEHVKMELLICTCQFDFANFGADVQRQPGPSSSFKDPPCMFTECYGISLVLLIQCHKQL